MAAKKFSLKGLFFEEGGAAPQASTAAKPSADTAAQQSPSPPPRRPGGQTAAPTSSPTSPSATYTPTADDSQAPDPGSLELLESAIEEANQQGYDYLEFRKAVEHQKAIIADEKIRFQAALAAASVMNVTAQKLADSARFYQTVLKSKERDFKEAQDAHMRREVKGRADDIAGIEQDITRKAAQISELTKAISDLQQRKTLLEQEMAEHKTQIETVQDRFFRTLAVVMDRIESDIGKITKYLMSS